MLHYRWAQEGRKCYFYHEHLLSSFSFLFKNILLLRDLIRCKESIHSQGSFSSVFLKWNFIFKSWSKDETLLPAIFSFSDCYYWSHDSYATGSLGSRHQRRSFNPWLRGPHHLAFELLDLYQVLKNGGEPPRSSLGIL